MLGIATIILFSVSISFLSLRNSLLQILAVWAGPAHPSNGHAKRFHLQCSASRQALKSDIQVARNGIIELSLSKNRLRNCRCVFDREAIDIAGIISPAAFCP
jgi:hypothetical protein